MTAAAAASTRPEGSGGIRHDGGTGSRGHRRLATVVKSWRSRRRPSWGGNTAVGAAAAAAGTAAGAGATAGPSGPVAADDAAAAAAAAAAASASCCGGVLEAALPPDTVAHVYSFLDTRTILSLTRVSRGACRQARLQVRSIDSEAVQVALPDGYYYGQSTSCIAWIGLYLRRPGWAWRKSLFQPPPYPLYEYPQGNPHNPALSALIQALPSFPNLDALALEYRNVRCEDCLALAAAVASGRACGKLRSLSVSCNFLRKEGGKALGACLRHLPDLRELVLNDNSIYFEAVAGICEALRDGACPRLERFSLAYNWVGVLGSREIGTLLGSGRMPRLRFLDLRGNGITSVGICFFVEALLLGAKAAAAAAHAHAKGTEAALSSSSLGAEPGVDDPFCAPSSFYRRHYLHEEAAAVAAGSDAGARAGATAAAEGTTTTAVPPALVSPCPFLTCIDLSFNYISEEGARALAEAVGLGLFPRLREIRIAQNPLDDHTGGLRLRAACEPWCRVVY